MCTVKSHRGDPLHLNEVTDDVADLGRTVGPEHVVCTTRCNRMVLSWLGGQKNEPTSTPVGSVTECAWELDDLDLNHDYN